VRNLRPAAINLAKASPDIAKSFHELNRFFNMGAYNPNGREPVTGNPVTDANRDEGYLFWLAWVGQNTTSLFSTSDAQGPLRRFIVFFNCTDLRALLSTNPAAATLLGFSNALNNPGLCPSSEGGVPGPGLIDLPFPKGQGGKKAPAPAPTNQTPGLPNVAPNLPGRPNLPVPALPGLPVPNVTPPNGGGSNGGSGDSNGGSGGDGGSSTTPNSDLSHLLPKGGKP
jgi:hypothetical protein